jgi:hypothetical protein
VVPMGFLADAYYSRSLIRTFPLCIQWLPANCLACPAVPIGGVALVALFSSK